MLADAFEQLRAGMMLGIQGFGPKVEDVCFATSRLLIFSYSGPLEVANLGH